MIKPSIAVAILLLTVGCANEQPQENVPQHNVLVADGDSITAGYGAATPYTELLKLRNPSTWTITNVAISGETLSTMRGSAASKVDPLYSSTVGRKIVVVWGGTNDIAFGLSTPEHVYANMQSYCAARHAAGWKCLIATMISRNGLDAQKNTLNNLILTDHSWADGLADFTGTNLGCDGCSLDSAYFQDGVHPNQNAIASIEAPVITAAIEAM